MRNADLGLDYFGPSEFNRRGHNWFEDYDPKWLVLMDALRLRLGSAIDLSPVGGALGRRAGAARTRHNVDLYGTVQAGDFFVRGVHKRAQAEAVIQEARDLGFKGVGVYPHWKNRNGHRQVGFHLDTRRTDERAEWGFIGRGENLMEVSLLRALQSVEG